MLPFINATLTAIAAQGTSADYDQPAAEGARRWAGELGIYVAEERQEDFAGDRVDELVKTRLQLPYTVGRLVQRGDTLAYTYDGAEQRRVAGTISRVALTGRVRVLLKDG